MIDYSTLLGHVAHVQPRLVDDLSFLILIIGVLMLLIDDDNGNLLDAIHSQHQRKLRSSSRKNISGALRAAFKWVTAHTRPTSPGRSDFPIPRKFS
ncbi:hypothetical protein V6Z96_008280 [Aspergillus fumigatus]